MRCDRIYNFKLKKYQTRPFVKPHAKQRIGHTEAIRAGVSCTLISMPCRYDELMIKFKKEEEETSLI